MAAGAVASQAVFGDVDVIGRVLSFLTLRQAAAAAITSRAFREAYVDSKRRGCFAPRLLVMASSMAAVLVCELHGCDASGALRAGTVVDSRLGDRICRTKSPWFTGIAISPFNHDVYAASYEGPGIIRLSGSSLKHKRTLKFDGESRVSEPEGIAFGTKRRLYVLRCGGGLYALQLDDDAHNGVCELKHWLPFSQEDPAAEGCELIAWGLTFHGDALYATVDRAYKSESYTTPPKRRGTGSVLKVVLDQDGDPRECVPFTQPCLTRPSGLRFLDDGTLLTTCMGPPPRLGRFAGPQGPHPGALLAWVELPCVPSPSGRSQLSLLAWDIAALPVPGSYAPQPSAPGEAGAQKPAGHQRVAVTMHRNAVSSRKGGGKPQGCWLSMFEFRMLRSQEELEQAQAAAAGAGGLTQPAGAGAQQAGAVLVGRPEQLKAQGRPISHANMVAFE